MMGGMVLCLPCCSVLEFRVVPPSSRGTVTEIKHL